MKNFLIKLWPIIFIIAVWFAFSSPYFLKGRVPYASMYQVNFFPPWSHYEKFGSPIKNNAMPDVHTQIYPWKKFTIETSKSGEIPFWNPNSFSGNPHLANFQSAVLSPLNLLFFIVPFIDAWSILVLLQPLLAGLFTFLFVKEIGVSKTGSLISSIAFMFCGFIVVWMAYGTLAFAILYLPLALFATERYSKTQEKKFLLLLALTLPFSFFSGHFQISLYFLAVILLYVVFKIVTVRKQGLLIFLPFAIFVGLLFSLPQLLPSIELYRQSIRSELFQVGEVIPFQYLITTIAPDFFGNPVTRNDWFGHYAEWAGFIGIWPLILGIYALVNIKNEKPQIAFFGILGLASLALAVNSPLSSFVVSMKIPVISTSALSRIIVLFSFSFAVLAGFGMDVFVRDMRETKTNKRIVAIFAVLGIFIVAIWFLLFFSNLYPAKWLAVAKRNFILPSVLFFLGTITILLVRLGKKSLLYLFYTLSFLVWIDIQFYNSLPVIPDTRIIVLSLLGFICIIFLIDWKKFTILIFGLFILTTSIDSLHFAQKWMPFDPKELVYPDVPVIEAIKENIGYGRIFGNIGDSGFSSYYGFPSIEGYDPLYISRYGEFIRGSDKGEYKKGERSVVHIDRQSKHTDRVLDLLGVTIVFHPIADTLQGWAYPVWRDKERYSLIYTDTKHQLFKNNFALPRAALFYDFEVIKSDYEIIKRFYSDDFDFRNKLIFEEDPGINSTKDASGSAQIISYMPNKIIFNTKTDGFSLLFLADNFYPGWKARVNGKEAKILRADYTFRAVKIPAGESEVEFTYEGWHF